MHDDFAATTPTVPELLVQVLANVDGSALQAWLATAPVDGGPELASAWLARGRALVAAAVSLDALREWCVVGVWLFAVGRGDLPSRRDVDRAAERVLVVAALRRYRSISAIARHLGLSRRSMRDHMKRLGLYEVWRRRGGFDD